MNVSMNGSMEVSMNQGADRHRGDLQAEGDARVTC